MALRARVGYSMRRLRSMSFGPKPSSGWTRTLSRLSCRLKRRAVSQRNTTGNSSPLDLCTDMICTAELKLPPVEGSCPFSARRRSQST